MLTAVFHPCRTHPFCGKLEVKNGGCRDFDSTINVKYVVAPHNSMKSPPNHAIFKSCSNCRAPLGMCFVFKKTGCGDGDVVSYFGGTLLFPGESGESPAEGMVKSLICFYTGGVTV